MMVPSPPRNFDAHMSAGADFPRFDEPMVGEDKDRLRLTGPVRPCPFERRNEARERARGRQARVDQQRVEDPRIPDGFRKALGHESLETPHVLAADRDACRHGVAAALGGESRFEGGADGAAEIDPR